MTTHTNGHSAVEVRQLTKTYPGGVEAEDDVRVEHGDEPSEVALP